MLRDSVISQLRKCIQGGGRCNQMSWESTDDGLLEEDVWGGNLGFTLADFQWRFFFWKSHSLLALGSSSNPPSSSSSSPILLPPFSYREGSWQRLSLICACIWQNIYLDGSNHTLMYNTNNEQWFIWTGWIGRAAFFKSGPQQSFEG